MVRVVLSRSFSQRQGPSTCVGLQWSAWFPVRDTRGGLCEELYMGLEAHATNNPTQLIPGEADAIMGRMNARFRADYLTGILREPGELLFVLGIAVVASALRLYRIEEKSIWLDESFSLWIAGHSLWEGWRWLIEVDQHPPLYYSLLHFWMEIFGSLEGAVRTLSALASVLTIPVFYAACRRLFDGPTAAIAVFILAVSPFHVQFAQETRMYALLTLEVACVIYFLARLVTSRVAQSRDWVGLAVSQALVMLTHNTAAVYLPVALNAAAGLIFLLFPSGVGGGGGKWPQKGESTGAGNDDESKESIRDEQAPGPQRKSSSATEDADAEAFWKNWVTFQGLAVLLWLPWAVPFIIQVIVVESGFWLPPPWPNLVLDTFRNFHFAFLPSDLPVRPVWMWGYTVLAALGLVGLLFRVGLSPRELRWNQRGRQIDGQDVSNRAALTLDSDRAAILIVCLFLVPHIVALLVSMRSPIYAERPLIWTTLPYFVLVSAGIRVIGGPLRRGVLDLLSLRRGVNFAGLVSTMRLGAQLFILGAILGLSSLSLNGYYFWFQKEAWDEAASHIAEQVRPGDMIVFNATWVQIPFEYYYERYDLDTALKGLPVDLFDRGELEPAMEEADIPRIQEILAGRDQVWLVYSHNWYSDPDGIIPRELSKIFVESEEADFEGIQIIRFAGRD